jgi:hypothetical protein
VRIAANRCALSSSPALWWQVVTLAVGFVGAAAAVVFDVDVFVVVIAADYIGCTYLLRIKRKE